VETAQAQGIGPNQTLRPGDQVKTEAGTVILHLEPSPKNVWDVSLYAPAIPGVVVALVGLLIAHWLSVQRDRRKELREICNELKTEADDAAKSALTAWRLGPVQERIEAVHDTKRKLQAVGILATTLARRTSRRSCIDVTQQVAELRRAATVDPFEDPVRSADDRQAGAIMVTLADLLNRVEVGFNTIYK
jgi:hypothetical protein